jgi:SAM-dependent methyltransferase
MLRVARGRLGDLRLIQADVSAAELGGTYDAIVCLFSAIAYAETPDHLADALRNLADHLRPGGVLVVDGWISRADWQVGFVNVEIAERNATKIVRVSHSSTDGDCSVVHFHFVIASPGDGIDSFDETHRLGLFEADDYVRPLEPLGLRVDVQPHAVHGRDRYIAVRPAT